MKSLSCLLLSLLFASYSFDQAEAFTGSLSAISGQNTRCLPTRTNRIVFMSSEDGEEEPSAKESLEEKMKKWEATEEEQKAATLGGGVPGRSDSFDLVLYILFPFMVLSGLAFAFFPLIMDKIDVDSVGPPPTI